MDFNKLRIFQIVSESESVTKAAKTLYRTQSAVSQQIALLEEELGFQLFARRQGRIYLSPEGKALSQTLRKNFDEIRAGILTIKDSLETIDGEIRLGVLLDDSTQFNLSSALVTFSKAYPRITFKISFGTNIEIETQLIDGQIDLGILITFNRRELFARKELAKATHTLIASTQLQKKLKSDGIAHFLSEGNIIDFSEDFLCLRPWVAKNFPEHLPILTSRVPTIIVPNHREALKMVERDWGIAILPTHLCEKHLSTGTLVYAFPKKKDLAVGLDIAYFANRTLSTREALFVETLTHSTT